MAISPGIKKPEAKEKKSVAMPFMIVAGLFLLFLMGWLYKKSFTTPPLPAPVGAAKINHEYIEGLYDRTHGDYSKLTDAEKQKVNGMTSGHGQIAFSTIKN